MSRRSVLEQRRALVVLSAEMQREAIVARLDQAQQHPGRTVARSLLGLLRHPWVRTAAISVIGLGLRKLRR